MKKFIIMDVKTSKKGMVYDFAYIICDLRGRIYEEQSLLISDTALVKKNNTLMLSDEILDKNKEDFYLNKILDGQWEITPIEKAVDKFQQSIKKFKIKECYAFDMVFCQSNLNNLFNELLDNLLDEEFFTSGLSLKSIRLLSLQPICSSTNFINWCKKNKKHPKCDIVTLVSYITNNPLYTEEGISVQNCKILLRILQYCKKREMKVINIDDYKKHRVWRY